MDPSSLHQPHSTWEYYIYISAQKSLPSPREGDGGLPLTALHYIILQYNLPSSCH